jgi:signal transduction histidine kinase
MPVDGLSLAYRSPYFFGLRPASRRMRARPEERLAERTRIAQDLHDTVLQGVLSATMQLHVAVDQLPTNSPAKLRLSRVLELMGRVMEEGRNAVRRLRSSNLDSDDLGQAFSRVPEELGTGQQIDFRVIVLGSSRKLHSVIRDEVYRIGREALVNAFRHSRATWIEVELEYAAKRFRIVVSDNGCGIDPQVLHAGRDGHWGLPGMREGAERVGARLRVWSRAAAGTEVELSVPNSIAFDS